MASIRTLMNADAAITYKWIYKLRKRTRLIDIIKTYEAHQRERATIWH